MAVTFGFYASLNGDRKYNSQQMSTLIDTLIHDGVFPNEYEIFATVPGPDLSVLVKSGLAWFNSTWTLNDGDLRLDIEAPDVTLGRIDSVVLEVDTRQSVRSNRIFLKKGLPATTPTAPALTNADGVFQHALAWVTVPASATSIDGTNINIRVGFADCPFITGIAAAAPIEPFFQQWETAFDDWFNNLQEQLGDNVATNLQNQIDKLNADALLKTDKATDAEITVGTNDEHYVTPKGLKKIKDEIGIVKLNGTNYRLSIVSGTVPIVLKTARRVTPNNKFLIYMFGTIIRTFNLETRIEHSLETNAALYLDKAVIDNQTILIPTTDNKTVYVFSINSDGTITKDAQYDLGDYLWHVKSNRIHGSQTFMCFGAMFNSSFRVYKYTKSTKTFSIVKSYSLGTSEYNNVNFAVAGTDYCYTYILYQYIINNEQAEVISVTSNNYIIVRAMSNTSIEPFKASSTICGVSNWFVVFNQSSGSGGTINYYRFSVSENATIITSAFSPGVTSWGLTELIFISGNTFIFFYTNLTYYLKVSPNTSYNTVTGVSITGNLTYAMISSATQISINTSLPAVLTNAIGYYKGLSDLLPAPYNSLLAYNNGTYIGLDSGLVPIFVKV